MSATARQLWLPALPRDSTEHAEALHPGSRAGFVTLARIVCDSSGEVSFKHIGHVPPSELGYFVKHSLPQIEDVYISQNRFRYKKRKVSTLLESDALFSDLDFYKMPGLENVDSRRAYDLVCETLFREGIPEPSLGIASGRGLQVLWLHSPLSSRDVWRWNICQNRIYDALKSFGADAKQRHAASVLRLVGTMHRKTNRRVECFAGSKEVWDFDDLANRLRKVEDSPIITGNEVDPITGELVYQPEPSSGPKIRSIYSQGIKRRKIYDPNAWNSASLWSVRFDELRIIRERRWPEGIQPGMRDTWLFLAACAFTWVEHPIARIISDLNEIGRQCKGQWDEARTRSAYSAALARMIKASRKESVIWNGKEIDPRYRFKRQTLVDWLELEDSEMREYGLRSIVSDSYHRELDAGRKRIQRGRGKEDIQGDIQCHDYRTAEEYHARQSREKDRPWEALGISRRTYYRRQAAQALADLGTDVTSEWRGLDVI